MQNKNENVKKEATATEINKREHGVQYGIDSTREYGNGGYNDKKTDFSNDTSEMRKAPGYNGAVPGVNTPDIRLPGAESKQNVSIPAFNPPVPNRAWTEMRKNLEFEMLSESEKKALYGNKKEYF